jgi:hypothetical protein
VSGVYISIKETKIAILQKKADKMFRSTCCAVESETVLRILGLWHALCRFRSASIRAVGKSRRSAQFSIPDHWLDGPNDEDPRYRAQQCHAGHDDEGPGEMAAALEHESGERRSHNACKVTDKILEASPATGGSWSSEGLSNGPDIR